MINVILIAVAAVAVIAVAALSTKGVITLRRPKKVIKQDKFSERWVELQKLCRDKDTWKDAVEEADDLLGDVLKKKRLRGKSVGERLVKAQKMLSDNDGVWFGHKLRTKISVEPGLRLKEADVKQALLGIRQALKDLGALPNGQPTNKK